MKELEAKNFLESEGIKYITYKLGGGVFYQTMSTLTAEQKKKLKQIGFYHIGGRYSQYKKMFKD